MNFFTPLRLNPKIVEVVGEGVLLRTPQLEDYREWRDLRAESRAFLTPWEPLWHDDELTRLAFRERIKQYRRWIDTDAGYPFFIFSQDEAVLLGGITLSNVRRGVAQCATLGYWIGAPHARKGHMTRAVQCLLQHGFGQLGLHRIEAACLPRNEASMRLLQRTGFTQEGFARSYLKINGNWEDHILWACRDG